MLKLLAIRPPEHVLERHGSIWGDACLIRIILKLAVARAALRARAPRRDRDDALVEGRRIRINAEDLVACVESTSRAHSIILRKFILGGDSAVLLRQAGETSTATPSCRNASMARRSTR